MNRPRAIVRLTFALLLSGAPAVSRAQPLAPAVTSPVPREAGRRYLVVLDISHSMKERLEATTALLDHLVGSGFDGRIRRGDTLGIWTFNRELNVGGFSIEYWLPERSAALAASAVSFVESAKFNGSADLRKALGAVREWVSVSDAVTVVVLTDGLTPFQGTPLDAEINATLARHAPTMSRAHLPFAVMLTGRGGVIVSHGVNSPSNPLLYPPESRPAPAVADVRPPLGIVLQPATIVEPKPALPPETPAVAAAPPTSAESGAAAGTATASPPTPVTQEAPPLTTETGAVILPQPVVTTPGTAATTIDPSPAANVPGEAQMPSKPTETTPLATEPPVVLTTPPEPKPTPTPSAVAVPSAQSTTPPAAPAAAAVIASVSTRPPGVANSGGAGPGAAQAPTDSKPVTATAAPAPSRTPTNQPASVLAVIPPEAGYSPSALLIAAFALVGVAVVLIVLLLRRRSSGRESVISLSMRNDKLKL